jgi:hypothetical protein
MHKDKHSHEKKLIYKIFTNGTFKKIKSNIINLKTYLVQLELVH